MPFGHAICPSLPQLPPPQPPFEQTDPCAQFWLFETHAPPPLLSDWTQQPPLAHVLPSQQACIGPPHARHFWVLGSHANPGPVKKFEAPPLFGFPLHICWTFAQRLLQQPIPPQSLSWQHA